jgi:hypothetical protein
VIVGRLEVVTSPVPKYSARRKLSWLATSGKPLEVVVSEDAALRRRFSEWAESSYDLIWINRPGIFELIGRPALGRTIVDLVDLEDQKIRTRLAALRAQAAAGGIRSKIHRQAATLQSRINASRWSQFQKSVARSVDTVVVCSSDDLELADLPNSVLVPNGYESPEQPTGRIVVNDPPVVLFQGDMHYGPNTDGAGWFVTDIAPLIRRQVPGVRIRLVGDPDGVVTKLDDQPAVTVVGRVESIEVELARADLIVAPLRYASGTRLKILEALAHRIPVVSTTIGAQGLGLEPGRHLLVADDTESFALACVSALTQPALRERLVAEGQAVFLQRHQWSVARERIRALALGSQTPAPSGPGSS